MQIIIFYFVFCGRGSPLWVGQETKSCASLCASLCVSCTSTDHIKYALLSHSSFNFTYLIKFWSQSENVGFKGFMRVLRGLT